MILSLRDTPILSKCRSLWEIRAVLVPLLFFLVVRSIPVVGAEEGKLDPQAIEFFERQVRPVLAQQCFSCHGPSQQVSSLRLDSRNHMLKGGSKGPAIVAGRAAESLLVKAIRHEGLKMPMGGKLKEEEIAAIEKWINLGAPWPAKAAQGALGPGDPGFYEKITKEHWAFQPVHEPNPPDGEG